MPEASKTAMRKQQTTRGYREHLMRLGWAWVHRNDTGPNRHERRTTAARLRSMARRRRKAEKQEQQ